MDRLKKITLYTTFLASAAGIIGCSASKESTAKVVTPPTTQHIITTNDTSYTTEGGIGVAYHVVKSDGRPIYQDVIFFSAADSANGYRLQISTGSNYETYMMVDAFMNGKTVFQKDKVYNGFDGRGAVTIEPPKGQAAPSPDADQAVYYAYGPHFKEIPSNKAELLKKTIELKSLKPVELPKGVTFPSWPQTSPNNAIWNAITLSNTTLLPSESKPNHVGGSPRRQP